MDLHSVHFESLEIGSKSISCQKCLRIRVGLDIGNTWHNFPENCFEKVLRACLAFLKKKLTDFKFAESQWIVMIPPTYIRISQGIQIQIWSRIWHMVTIKVHQKGGNTCLQIREWDFIFRTSKTVKRLHPNPRAFKLKSLKKWPEFRFAESLWKVPIL